MVFGDERLIGVLSQGVKAYVFDVTDDGQYTQSYADYARGMALDFVVMHVPAGKVSEVSDIFRKNKDVEINLPLDLQAITVDVSSFKPIGEVQAAHERAVKAGRFSAEGLQLIRRQYAGEAGVCGDLKSWVFLMGEYITGLNGQNPMFSKERILSELGLEDASRETIAVIKKDLKTYVNSLKPTFPGKQ